MGICGVTEVYEMEPDLNAAIGCELNKVIDSVIPRVMVA
jgi:hypothetical protein